MYSPRVEQLSLLPFAAPSNVTLHLDQLVTRVTRLSPDLDPQACLLILAEFALVSMVLDSIETQLKLSITEKARRLGIV